jgi:hypothetical protein
MNKVYDVVLGWPGLVVFLILVFVGITSNPSLTSEKERCEQAGGKYVQTMKTYHTCRMPKTTDNTRIDSNKQEQLMKQQLGVRDE